MDINKTTFVNNLEVNKLLSLKQLSPESIASVILNAREKRDMRLVHEKSKKLENTYVLLLTKSSLPRSSTTCSIAIKELSGEPLVTSFSGEKLENALKDKNYLKAISSFGISAVTVCTSKQSDAQAFDGLSVPLINATAKFGPCEALASAMTVADINSNFTHLKITVVGNGSSVPEFITVFQKLGADVTLLPTENIDKYDETLRYISQFGEVKIEKEKSLAFKDADFIYFTDSDSVSNFTTEDFSLNVKDYKILSATPICENLLLNVGLNENNSLILKQAENLLHIIKALLDMLTK